MRATSRLSAYDDTPVYTIKTVVQFTGITPATLRAWERRYGVLAPSRSGGGYRLYSERDIATLMWLKDQVDSGVTISRAVALLNIHHQSGEEPELAVRLDLRSAEPAAMPSSAVRTSEALADDLTTALLAFREDEAEVIMGEAFALYPLDVVVEDIVTPTLVEIGERWHRREATVVQEHFATAFLRRRLAALFDVYDEASSGPLAITGSAPGEWHDVGILLVSLALRRHGWRVIYLGQNVPAEHLIDEITRQRPQLVCLSASTRESAEGLVQIAREIAQLSAPRPRFVVGGRALNMAPELRAQFPGSYLGTSAREFIAALTTR